MWSNKKRIKISLYVFTKDKLNSCITILYNFWYIYPLKPKKSRFKEEIKRWNERHFIFWGGRKNIILLEGSQATPARPSGRKNVKVKTLWWWGWLQTAKYLISDSFIDNLGNKSAASTTGGNFDELKVGRSAWEACSSNLEFGNHLSICLKTEENQESLCRGDRSQDLWSRIFTDAAWIFESQLWSPHTFLLRPSEDSLTCLCFNFREILNSESGQGSSVSGRTKYDHSKGKEFFSCNLWFQTGFEAHPASCIMDAGSPFSGCKMRPRRDADHSPHLVPKSWMSRSYTSSPPASP
jgi:hypothetical protein